VNPKVEIIKPAGDENVQNDAGRSTANTYSTPYFGDTWKYFDVLI
jgi:hypothetical protein